MKQPRCTHERRQRRIQHQGLRSGETTAALGLALRAAGAGFRVFIAQFVKGTEYSELAALSRLEDRITVRSVGRRCFIHDAPEPEDVAAAREGLKQVREILLGGRYDVVILDEANIAVHFGLFSEDDLLEVANSALAWEEFRCCGPTS
ncbi:MAG: cob(I)yrinic acid a,c-diamide adenosyltransferase [Gemmatimonadales bacterium]